MKKVNYIVTLFVLVASNLFGQQDVHFSQFSSSPLTLNPANAGVFDGDLRTIMNYRSQWATVTQPYTTMAFSADFPILKKMKGGMFGMGVNFLKDDAGDSKLSTLNYALSLAYHLDISGGHGNHFISIGFQGGMIQRSIGLGNLTWNDQWDGVDFDREIATVDQLGGRSVNAFDMSTGLHWYNAQDDKNRFFAGISLFHLNSPNVGFNESSKLIKKYTLHGGGDFALNDDMSIMPNFVFVKQGANQYMDIGAEVKFYLQKSTKFTNYKNQMFFAIGPYLRWGDAMYLVAKFNYVGITASVSYDFNVSDLSAASSGNGGFEIMLGYKIDLNANGSRGHNVRFH